jgi:hypothetical protein
MSTITWLADLHDRHRRGVQQKRPPHMPLKRLTPELAQVARELADARHKELRADPPRQIKDEEVLAVHLQQIIASVEMIYERKLAIREYTIMALGALLTLVSLWSYAHVGGCWS